MITSIAANHAKGKSSPDENFRIANAAAVAAAAKYGADKVTNATIGAILDEDENLFVCRLSKRFTVSCDKRADRLRSYFRTA